MVDWEGWADEAGFSDVDDYVSYIMGKADGELMAEFEEEEKKAKLNMREVTAICTESNRSISGRMKTVFVPSKRKYNDLIEVPIQNIQTNEIHLLIEGNTYYRAALNPKFPEYATFWKVGK